MNYLAIILLVIVFCSCSSNSVEHSKNIDNKNDSTLNHKQSNLIWKRHGMTPLNEQELKIVAEKLGFEYEGTSGCFTSSDLKHSIDSNNKVVDSILIKKLGNDWQSQWSHLADSIFFSRRDL